jgi:tRNA dimethylallyltransferase
VIADIVKRGKLPIVVGGTGLYIKGIIDGIATAEVPKSNRLRKSLENKTTDELFEMLAQIDSIKAAGMNTSDKRNPRRLIRAIEIATWKTTHGNTKTDEKKIEKYSVLQIGLIANNAYLGSKIEKRVSERFKERLKNEIAELLKNHVDWDMQSMSSMGYGQWRAFFEGRKSEKEIIKLWETEEKKYVKRQIVWFKNDNRINWFNIVDLKYPENVEKTVEKWHNSTNA